MDIQFVLDVYVCAMYIVSYNLKAHKGMSVKHVLRSGNKVLPSNNKLEILETNS